MPDLREPTKTNPLLTAGMVGVVSILCLVLVFFIIHVARDDDGAPHAAPSERVYHVDGGKSGRALAYVSSDAYYEAHTAFLHDDRAAFDKITQNKGIRLPGGTPVQMMGELRGEVIDVRVLSGEHRGETVYITAFDVH